jgi:hypothetical protein
MQAVFEKAYDYMEQGIQDLGIDAEKCRIGKRPIEEYRIQNIKQRMQRCFG